jgi:transposase, IS5 family
VRRVTGELAGLATRASHDAAAVLRNARRALRKSTGRVQGRLRRAIDELAIVIDRAAGIVAQTRLRLAGGKPDSATRLVSQHDPDARPITKGRLGKPVEFGYKAQVMDNEDGMVLDYTVKQGNPADAPQLVPAVQRVRQRTGTTPRAVAADRGYGEAGVETALHDLGVKDVAIPRKGRTGPTRQRHERPPAFRKLVKWRTGCEGRISTLKHRYGWDRTLWVPETRS